MNEIVKILLFMVSCILTNNFIFSRFLGCCPFLGVSNKVETAMGMGLAVTFVMALASLFTYMVYHFVLVPLSLTYLDTISFILVIASLVQVVEMFLKKFSPALYKALGIYLPLITTNCAVLGMATLVAEGNYTFLEMFVYSFSSAVGFLLVIYIFSTIREKLNRMEGVMKDIPIALITAGLMAMIFARFAGVI